MGVEFGSLISEVMFLLLGNFFSLELMFVSRGNRESLELFLKLIMFSLKKN